MSILIKLTCTLNDFHYDLFHKYEKTLNLKPPERGFLKKDCFFTPQEEGEFYPCIEYGFQQALIIIKELNSTRHKEVHAYLQTIFYFIKKIEQLVSPRKADKTLKSKYQAMQAVVEQARIFLKNFDYKLSRSYQANNAILLTCMLYEFIKLAFNPNILADISLLKNVSTAKVLSLSEVASAVIAATKKNPRNVQFIAIGVAANGSLWATTNYHTPVVYPLECLLDLEKYTQAEKFRHNYKVEHRKDSAGALIFRPNIHAETMIASLKETLGIKHILLIDGNGNKVENCFCCSHYLCAKGFTSEPHIDRIQNYELPSEKQISVVADWALAVKEKIPQEYVFVPPAVLPPEATENAREAAKEMMAEMLTLLPYTTPPADNELALQTVFDSVKKGYPDDGVPKLMDTYHTAKRLADPKAKTIDRTIVRASCSTRPHPNRSLQLFADGRLAISARGNRLSPVDRDSPRSVELADLSNAWLAEGDASISEAQIDGIVKFSLRR